MTETWNLLDSPAGAAPWNMAVDEALLRTAAGRGRPLLRVYAWVRPAVSFGYFQKFPAGLADRYVIVRRPTGGGVVYHGDDTTYTVIIPPGHELDRMKTTDAYGAIHRAIAAAFGRQPVLQAGAPESPRGEYECFERPVAGDVVADGRKLAGGAQRRTKWGMLHQGSIAARLTVEQLADGFRRMLPVRFVAHRLTAGEQALSEQLAKEKYSTDLWNKRVI